MVRSQFGDGDESLPPEEIRQRILNDLETMAVLPSLPQVCQRILQLAKNPDSEIREWIETLRADPMTCAMILRHAHSAAYGFQGEVNSIDRAVPLLGKNTIKNLVVCDAIRRTFIAVSESGFSLDSFWLHSAAVGFAARILSFPLDEERWTAEQQLEFEGFKLSDEEVASLKEIDLPKRLKLADEDAFLGGMMHDLGIVVMVSSYPDLYPLLVEELKAHEWGETLQAIEESITQGLTHATVGEIIAEKWNLEEGLRTVIKFHHHADVGDRFSFLVGVADVLGEVLYPLPEEATYPLGEAFETGELKRVARFLPEGFFDQDQLSSEELVTLAKAVFPAVKRLSEEMRDSIFGG